MKCNLYTQGFRRVSLRSGYGEDVKCATVPGRYSSLSVYLIDHQSRFHDGVFGAASAEGMGRP